MEEIEKDVVAVPGPDAWSEALFQLEYIARLARELGDWELAESVGLQPTAFGKKVKGKE